MVFFLNFTSAKDLSSVNAKSNLLICTLILHEPAHAHKKSEMVRGN